MDRVLRATSQPPTGRARAPGSLEADAAVVTDRCVQLVARLGEAGASIGHPWVHLRFSGRTGQSRATLRSRRGELVDLIGGVRFEVEGDQPEQLERVRVGGRNRTACLVDANLKSRGWMRSEPGGSVPQDLRREVG